MTRLRLLNWIAWSALLALTIVVIVLPAPIDRDTTMPSAETIHAGSEVDRTADQADASAKPGEVDRQPIALALVPSAERLLTANRNAGTVSLVDLEAGTVLDEVVTGRKPHGVAVTPDGQRAVVTHWWGYDAAILALEGDALRVVGRVDVGPEPRGVVIGSNGRHAYLCLGVSNEVVRIDLDRSEIDGRVEVGREPWGIALSPDSRILAVGNNRGSSVSLVNTESLEVVETYPIDGANLRQLAFSSDGSEVYVAHMKNREFAITARNIDIGWVLGQRVTKITRGRSGFETLSLDPQGEAVGDVYGLVFSPDGTQLAVAAGGTHEVLIFRTDRRRLPWRRNGSRDLMAGNLVHDRERFVRVDCGGRPTELACSPDGRSLYVANYFANAVQVIDLATGQLVRQIDLGSAPELSLVRRGEMLFHDADRSFNQWYSCNTCHSEGHTNGEDYDTTNDGYQDLSTFHIYSRKTTPSLRNVTHTAPWTWHGWQTSLPDAMVKSFTETMQGPEPSAEDVEAIIAFLGSLDLPPNPYRNPDGFFTEAALRGREVFQSEKAACNTCHGGEQFTKGTTYIVGLEEPRDRYEGYNPPSLRGVYDRDPYLHDGRANSLREVLTGDHNPDYVTGLGELTEQELDDLIAYLIQL